MREGFLRLGLRRLHVTHPELVEELLQQLPLFGGQVAAGLLFEQRQDVDDLLRGGKVGLCLPVRSPDRERHRSDTPRCAPATARSR